jgi:DnaK suppressor protein
MEFAQEVQFRGHLRLSNWFRFDRQLEDDIVGAKVLNRYRKLLQDEIRRLQRQNNPANGSDFDEAAELASDSYERDGIGLDPALVIALRAHDRAIYDQVVTAWGRIENGSFGLCTECHQKIGAERLQALPYTPYCVKCARNHEPSRELAARTA